MTYVFIHAVCSSPFKALYPSVLHQCLGVDAEEAQQIITMEESTEKSDKSVVAVVGGGLVRKNC